MTQLSNMSELLVPANNIVSSLDTTDLKLLKYTTSIPSSGFEPIVMFSDLKLNSGWMLMYTVTANPAIQHRLEIQLICIDLAKNYLFVRNQLCT